MNEITLMDAIHRMYVHKDKKSPVRFLVTFDAGIAWKASFGESWSKTMKTWRYFVKDGAYELRYAYQDREVVSAIMSICGMKLYGASVRYHIQQEGGENRDKKQPAPQAHIGRCDVCGTHGSVYLRCSSMGSFSFSYCDRCIQSGEEPYWFTVSTVAINGLLPDDVTETAQQRIRGILRYLNRPEDAFKRDVYRSYHYLPIQSDL